MRLSDEELLIIGDEDFRRVMALRPSDPLREELARAVVVPSDKVPADVATLHSRLRYLDERTGERREVEIVLPEEADPARGKVSVLAPVGAALLGLSVGQSIEWEFPRGETRRLRLEALLPHGRETLPEGSLACSV
jgi:regulator of nucleoside diphosphate kinase